jgi:dihydropyrimidinase
MALLIRGGRIITPTEDYTGDVYAEGETITRIEPHIDDKLVAPGAEIIDARGKYVFPGFIDAHVHIYLPFMGTYAADDYESASKAALAGGTTTLIEMIVPDRATSRSRRSSCGVKADESPRSTTRSTCPSSGSKRPSATSAARS